MNMATKINATPTITKDNIDEFLEHINRPPTEDEKNLFIRAQDTFNKVKFTGDNMGEKIEAQNHAEVDNLRHKDMLARTIPATNSTMKNVEHMIKVNIDDQVNLNDIHSRINDAVDSMSEIMDKQDKYENIATINTIEDIVVKNLDEQQDIDIIDKKIDNLEKIISKLLEENKKVNKELVEIKKTLKQ